MTVAEVRAALDAVRPLSAADVAARQRIFGRNEIAEARRDGSLRTFLRQFRSPLIYLLLIAAAVSVVIGEASDAAFIFVVLLVNAAVGTAQEIRAERGTAALRRMLRQTALVERAEGTETIDAAELVPGDIVLLESGARVPADLRLLRTDKLLIDESLLTGESVPVAKDGQALFPVETTLGDRRNMAFGGTTVLAGRASGVVTATGLNSELGGIAQSLLETQKAPPPLIVKLDRFTRVLGLTILSAVAVLGVLLVWRGMPLAEVFFVGVALIVSAIPEGLPVAITVALAIATARMARRHVIVRSLPVVEALGACTLIASDKTGTLTQNRLTLRRIFVPQRGACDAEDLLREPDVVRALLQSAVLANEAHATDREDGYAYSGDTVDIALLAYAERLGFDPRAGRRLQAVVATIPFEAEQRFSAAFCRTDGAIVGHVKGAAETVIPMCANIDPATMLAAAERMAGDGYRVLALAAGQVGEPSAGALRGLSFLGLVGLIDPARPEVPDAIARCRDAGIRVCMITGDHPATAMAIARELGIAAERTQLVTGGQLASVSENVATVRELIAGGAVFARVEPRQKLSIVQALQALGHVVAVTGDGVNDAPALRQSDIGVAMGGAGTDIARDAADLVVTDDNFASIVAGVEEGRVVMDNVRKILVMLLATGSSEILVFVFVFLAGLPMPFLAVQLLWLNLVTNGIQDVALAFERAEQGVLRRPPRAPDEPLLDRRLIEQVVLYGLSMGAIAFAMFFWCLEQGHDEVEARNATLLLMVILENMLCLAVRSERRSVFLIPLGANWMIVAGVAATLLIHLVAMHAPGLSEILQLGAIDAVLIGPLLFGAAMMIGITEVYKLVRRIGAETPSGARSRVPVP
jgi:calcium-translocating P-type ATPase